MASERPLSFDAQFYDGETAVTRGVTVTADEAGLAFPVAGGSDRRWTYRGLVAVEPARSGMPVRLSYEHEHTARLIVPARHLPLLLERAPQLKGGVSLRRMARVAAIVALAIAGLAALGYGMLSIAPQTLAAVMPDSWRQRLGEQTEASFVRGSKQCTSEKGVAALNRLASRTTARLADPPDFSVRVFDMPMVNAFALPGGRIVITGKLIRDAASPDEVAGVLAHELGHVALRHPEAQLVRVLGLQVLLSIASGGGADTLGNLAGLLAILRYTRSAEREADEYAQATLETAKIDPLALRRFLESVRKSEPETDAGVLSTIGDILATHPGIEERIERMRPLPDGKPEPALDEAAWRDLKAICR